MARAAVCVAMLCAAAAWSAVGVAQRGEDSAEGVGELSPAAAETLMRELLREHKVMMFAKSYCGFCKAAKRTLSEAGIKYYFVDMDHMEIGRLLQSAVNRVYHHRTVPAIFVDGNLIGGYSDLMKLQDQGRLRDTFHAHFAEL